ncbi:MAG: 50S ribosomal protein L11 methyltransferase [Mesorhizobium sp.]
MAAPSLLSFIRQNLPLTAVPSVPEIRLHTAHSGSGLRRIEQHGKENAAPYWAYPWAGGMTLARYILDHPQSVRGRHVLDLGAGSGLVAIATAKAGAGSVLAAEIDRNALAALELNLTENAASATVIDQDIIDGEPPAVDLVLVGDLFYEPRLAKRVTAFLDRCVAAGIEVLVGDLGRKDLPLSRLRLLAEYPVTDFGDAKGAQTRPGRVFSFEHA